MPETVCYFMAANQKNTSATHTFSFWMTGSSFRNWCFLWFVHKIVKLKITYIITVFIITRYFLLRDKCINLWIFSIFKIEGLRKKTTFFQKHISSSCGKQSFLSTYSNYVLVCISHKSEFFSMLFHRDISFSLILYYLSTHRVWSNLKNKRCTCKKFILNWMRFVQIDWQVYIIS